MKEKIKAGDFVRIKCGEDTKCRYKINDEMIKMEEHGGPFEVRDVDLDRDGKTIIKVWNMDKLEYFYFCPNDVTLVRKGNKKENKGDNKMKINKYEVILNDPAVILFVNEVDPYRQRKYVSKAHNEPFDPEKGLLMCLAKANGISHLDLKRMIKSAKVQSKRKKTSTNKEEVYVNDEKFEQPELDSKREKLYKEIPQRNMEDNMTKIPFHFDVPTSDIDSGFKVPMAEEKVVVSPKGKKRGQPYKFFAGDKVIVRDCSYYKYTTNANAKQLLNKVLEIGQDNSDFAGSVYIVNGFEFSGSELEPIK